MRLLLVPLPLLTSLQLIVSLTPYCIWGHGISLLPLLLLLILLLSIILPLTLLEAHLLLLITAVTGTFLLLALLLLTSLLLLVFCKGSWLPAVLTSADVPNVCCASVDPAVADILTAVAAVSTAVKFFLLWMFPTSLASMLLLAALCILQEDLRSPNIRERNGKKYEEGE